MATVTVVTGERTLEIEAASITDGSINAEGHLILLRHDGGELDLGAVSGMQTDTGSGYEKVDAFSYIGPGDPGAVPDGSVWYDTDEIAGPFASDNQKGLVELATNAETLAGTDTARAVTPSSLKAVADTKQPTDSDLTAFAALAPANDDILQRKSGTWVNRTMAQLMVDLAAFPLTGGTIIGTINASMPLTSTPVLGGFVLGDAFDRWRVLANGIQEWGSGTAARDVIFSRTAANQLSVTSSDFRIATTGRGLRVAEGTNGKMGTATLNGTTAVVVNNTSVTSNSRIFLTSQAPNASTAFGTPYVFARSVGTSFTIKSTVAGDLCTVAWHIIEPG